ncbi:ATP-binding protein [Weissella bombi]|uniref:AAA domain-containing protein n=1 Tax=Weissella bombi TaxID=1505725 RepID=A0A1C3ZCN6_9LACO|nr:AAA family ATPase [Weissella bombi]SCB80050.1 AAA domain-containing protein [Weissella bombi]
MWIKQAHIVGFGQFSQRTFNFVQGLQIIQGLNEAGKTTLHQFLFDMLFGFPQAKGRKINTYEPLNKGPYGGSIQFEVDNQLYELERLGRTQTTTTLTAVATGQKFADPEAMLTKLLGPVDRELYLAIFSFDQEALMAIFSLKPDDFASYLRTLATPGAQEWLDIANQWEKNATAKFGTTKTAHREINQSLAQLKQQRQQLQANISQQPSLDKLQTDAENLKQRLNSLRQRQDQIQGKMTHQQSQTHLLPIYQRWHKIKQQVQAAGDSLDLTVADQAERVRQQLSSLDEMMVTTAITKQQVADADEAINKLEKINQQQEKLTTQQAAAMQAQQQILEKYHWQQLPPVLTDAQKTKLNGQSVKPQATSENKSLLIAAVVGVVLLIIALLSKHIVIGIVLLIICLVIGWWQGQKQHSQSQTTVTDDSLPAAYQQMSTADILASQAEVQKVNDLLLATNQSFQDQQAALSELVDVKVSLNWLGKDLSVAEYRQRLMQVHVQQETMGQQQLQRSNLQQTLQELYKKLGVKDEGALRQRRDAQRQVNDLRREASMLEEQLQGADLHELAAQDAIKDQPQSTSDNQEMLQRIQREKAQVNQQLAEINVQLQNLQTDTSIESQQQMFANQVTMVNQQLKQYFVDRLGSEWIRQALNAAIIDRLPNLLKQASSLFARLTNNHYQSVQQTKTLLKVVRDDRKVLGVNQLSKGTASQLYVALRLAFVMNVSETLQLPLLIDDAFVDFDDQRRETMMKVLAELAADNQQIFYFTGRQSSDDNAIALVRQ